MYCVLSIESGSSPMPMGSDTLALRQVEYEDVSLPSSSYPITKIRCSHDLLIFVMEIPIPGQTVLVLTHGPLNMCCWVCCCPIYWQLRALWLGWLHRNDQSSVLWGHSGFSKRRLRKASRLGWHPCNRVVLGVLVPCWGPITNRVTDTGAWITNYIHCFMSVSMTHPCPSVRSLDMDE